MQWQKITVVGAGLLGGSLGLAIRRLGLAGRVVALVRREASIGECREVGAVDLATRDAAEAVRGADLVILCTPVAQMRDLLERFGSELSAGAVVTDVGSVKLRLVEELEPLAGRFGVHYIGSHPMAGSEKTGIRNASGGLFDGSVCVVTPTERSEDRALERVELFWRDLGCRVLAMPPGLHDEVVGRCSHLPHILASQLARYVLSPMAPPEQALLSGTGFRDTTRLASGSPEMWRDIAMMNQGCLLRILDDFIDELAGFRRQLAESGADGATLMEFFDQARRQRDAWLRNRYGSS